ncbi:alcohol dehydrogenase [Psittacicella melopsittaci]|uniref:Alcohol dehydrogenase n=1 Tax=Psittacicella melopsittaci TaxID=2028576 RepID=A0A3A1Y664_9GAMM|nr:zinc-binding dehydrogenase [Psittacicella melopsittaci]RIY32776.1 alcohol dehydrogenase [Psittacicella melopsittaci]
MQAVIHKVFGEPENVVEIAQVEKPTPKEGEVLIELIMSPIHNHDLWTIRGTYGYKPNLPETAGSEAVGRVVALGDNVTNVQVGQRVSVANIHQTWAEYFVAPANALVPIPDALSDEQAAQLIAMPFSAITLLEFLEVKAGQWIILNAASGMIGKTTAMLAKERGVNVINLVRSSRAIAELNELGIEHVVATDQENWQEQVKAILGDNSLVAGVDSIGGQASLELSRLLGQNALFVSFGTMGGEPVQIPVGDLIFKQITVKGFWGSIVAQEMSAEVKAKLMRELITNVIAGKVLLPVGGVYPLAQAAQACAASLKSGKAGKILLCK